MTSFSMYPTYSQTNEGTEFWFGALSPKWDGSFQGGKAAPGVYFYEVNIKSNIEQGGFQEDQHLGTVTLLR